MYCDCILFFDCIDYIIIQVYIPPKQLMNLVNLEKCYFLHEIK